MATNIQSHAELKGYLEQRLRSQFATANQQEIDQAVEIAMGRRGYALDQLQHEHDGQQRQQNNQQQNQQRQQANGQQQGQQSHQSQQSLSSHESLQGLQDHHEHLAAVRDAAISAAQRISAQDVKMAAIASAWVGFAATSVLHEQDHDKASRN